MKINDNERKVLAFLAGNVSYEGMGFYCFAGIMDKARSETGSPGVPITQAQGADRVQPGSLERGWRAMRQRVRRNEGWRCLYRFRIDGSRMKSPFSIGDIVKPRPQWISDPNNVPSGRIRKIESSGDDGAIHVEGERRAFAGYVFMKEDCLDNAIGSPGEGTTGDQRAEDADR